MKKIISVAVLENYRLALVFDDGVQGTVDLHKLTGSGVFALWNDYDSFKNVKIGDSGELVWSDQVDLCPDSLYLQVTGKKAEDVFPGLNKECANA
ncbi:MAG: DUF2442 domain-containing protein [Pirellulaceae bacterium]|nr:DUF2442 domain-containing protein [Pirellulaceae bacterium]